MAKNVLLGFALFALLTCAGCASRGDGATVDGGPSDGSAPHDAMGDPPDGSMPRDAAGGLDSGHACTTPVHAPCDVFPQCGCMVDENCEVIDGTGGTGCAIAGPVALYNQCAGFNQCPRGSECIGMVCKPFCSTDADCPGANRACVQVTTTGLPGGAPIPGLKVCTAGCDPRMPSMVCGPGASCFPTPWDGAGHDTGDCIGGAGTGVGPMSCTSNMTPQCMPGRYCTTTLDCASWCRVGHDTDCTAPSTCQGFSMATVIGGVTYGLCL